MKTHKELTIDVSGEEHQQDFIDSLREALPAGWEYDEEAEKRLSGLTSGKFHCFVCDKPASQEVALLTIVTTTSGSQLYVSNIVPKNVDQLDVDQYNQILTSFADCCVKPIAGKKEFNYSLSSEEWLMEDHLDEATYNKLLGFSRAANKTTGSAHPLDRERWLDFVISCVRSENEIHASDLARWLREVEGWPNDVSSDLAIEFELGVELLKRYREE